MTREEIKKVMRDTKKEIVLKNLHRLLSLVEGYPEYEDCISYAIEKLEQESILDKIRAEIDEQIKYNTYFNSDMAKGEIIAFEWVKRKIDEYRKEQE